MPFREESCRSSCIYSGPLHSYSRDAVSQHPSTRAGAESIELIYSGRALQALSDLARQFRCHPIFWRTKTLTTLARPLPRRLLLPLPTNLPTSSSPHANEQMFEVGATESTAMTAMMAQVLISCLSVPVPSRAYIYIYVYVDICNYIQIQIYIYMRGYRTHTRIPEPAN